MEVRINRDSVEISGYVNAIERNSKPLMSRIGQFIERICKGAFKNALKRNDDVHILLNHNWDRDLGSTKQGNLELEEDNIGLKARATITDKSVIKKARDGDLVGWSFGFEDRDVVRTIENGMTMRAVKDLDLHEVSILDRTKTPAYEGTLITARSENRQIQFRSEPFVDGEVVTHKCDTEECSETREEKADKEPTVVEQKTIDYSKYEKIINEMKGDFKNEH